MSAYNLNPPLAHYFAPVPRRRRRLPRTGCHPRSRAGHLSLYSGDDRGCSLRAPSGAPIDRGGYVAVNRGLGGTNAFDWVTRTLDDTSGLWLLVTTMLLLCYVHGRVATGKKTVFVPCHKSKYSRRRTLAGGPSLRPARGQSVGFEWKEASGLKRPSSWPPPQAASLQPGCWTLAWNSRIRQQQKTKTKSADGGRASH